MDERQVDGREGGEEKKEYVGLLRGLRCGGCSENKWSRSHGGIEALESGELAELGGSFSCICTDEYIYLYHP